MFGSVDRGGDQPAAEAVSDEMERDRRRRHRLKPVQQRIDAVPADDTCPILHRLIGEQVQQTQGTGLDAGDQVFDAHRGGAARGKRGVAAQHAPGRAAGADGDLRSGNRQRKSAQQVGSVLP